MNIYVFLSVMLIFLVFSGLFSATEIAYTSLNRMRLEKAAEKSRGAKTALWIKNRFSVALSTVLIGNNLVNILASSIATSFFVILTGDESTGSLLSTLIVTVVVLIFGEIIPKILGKKFSLAFACRISIPFAILMALLRPVTWVVVGLVGLLFSFGKKKEMPTVTEDELATMIETAEEEGVIDEDKSELVQSALSFSESTVEDILVPRIQMDMLDIDDDYETILEKVFAFPHTRIPVYEETVDHIIGILNLNHFYRAIADAKREGGDPSKIDIRSLLIAPVFVHKTTKLQAALNELRARQVHLMVVLDEYGGTMGLITMEDILEEIVGDIWDESDTIETEVSQIGENSYDVDGMTTIDDFFESVDLERRDLESEYTTMGGWAIEMLDSNPHEGDSFTYRNLYIIVTEMKENRVARLSVVVSPESAEDGEEEE